MISSKIGALYPRRSVFNRSSEHKFNCDMGYLIPIEIQQMYPGDKVKLSMQALLRTTPLVVPPMHEINAYCQAYFVAYRALDENFEDYISGGEDGQNSYILPHITYEEISAGSQSVGLTINDIKNGSKFFKYTNWDYLGFPLHPFNCTDVTIMTLHEYWLSNVFNYSLSNSVGRVSVISYPFMAISNIWNEYYRDENLEDPIDDNKLSYCAFKKPFPVHWNRDYFTNCLPFQQRGVSPALPLYGNLNASFDGYSDFAKVNLDNLSYSYSSASGSAPTVDRGVSISGFERVSDSDIREVTIPASLNFGSAKFMTSGKTGSYGIEYNLDSGSIPLPITGDITLDNNLTAGTIAELRTAFQIQLWQERNARAGVRYTEFIQAHFGIHPLDERLDRPEYIGGCKFPVITNEVIQTSESSSNSPQGTLAGRGIGVSDQYIGTYTAKEYGVLVVFFYIKPKSNYSSQGVNRQWQVQSRFDFYSPEFAHLSMQGVKNSELYVDTLLGSGSKNDEIFGYTGRFDELRTNYTTVSGDFRPDVGLAPYTDWTLARAFSETPTLGPEFLQCKPDKRIFAVQDEPGFLCDIGIRQQWLRPLPSVAEPGFIDHSYY